MGDEPLFTPEDAAAIVALHGTETPPASAAPPATTPNPSPSAPPAASPTPAPAPTPAPTTPASEAITLEDLAALAAETVERLERIEVATPKQEPKPDPAAALRAAERAELLADAPPAVAEALRAAWAAQDASERAIARVEAQEASAALQAAENEQRDILLDEARDLVTRFPGVTEQDLEKCYDRIATDEKARRMSMWQVADLVLGYDYLNARRTPPGVPAGGNSPMPTGPPPASVVTITGGGSPAPAAGVRPASSAATDPREIMAEVLANPQERALLGRHG